MRRALRLLAVLIAAALVFAGCDGDDDNGADDENGAAPTTTEAGADATTTTGAGGEAGGTTQAGATTLTVVEDDEFGTVVRDADGRALYAFTDDTENTSNCTGGCLDVWPPLAVDGEATASPEVTGEVGTITRDDGSTHVTLAGRPLYHYAEDTAPGHTNGQGVGGKWFQVSPVGDLVGM